MDKQKSEEDILTYAIWRFWSDPKYRREIVKSGLTLEQAQEHCSDDSTEGYCAEKESWWFDGYDRE